MNSQYSMVIQWSDEDHAFIVSLPEFGDGCKTHGATYEEAVKNGHEVLDMLIDHFQQDGQTLPTPQKLPASVSVS